MSDTVHFTAYCDSDNNQGCQSGPEDVKRGWISTWLCNATGCCQMWRNRAVQQIHLDVDVDIMELTMTSQHHRELEHALAQHQSEFDWTPGSPTVIITYRGKKTNQEAWESACADAVHLCINQFTTCDIQVEDDFWPAVLKKLPVIRAALDKSSLHLLVLTDSKAIRIVCLESELEHSKNVLRGNLEEIKIGEIKKSYSRRTESGISEEKMALLKKMSFAQNLMTKHSELEVIVDDKKREISFEGPKEQFTDAITSFQKQFHTMSDEIINLQLEFIEILKDWMDTVMEEFERNGIEAMLFLNIAEQEAKLVGASSTDARRAAELVTKLLVEKQLTVDDENVSLLETTKWWEFCEQIEDEFQVKPLTYQSGAVRILGPVENVRNAAAKLEKFIDENAVRKKQFQCASSTRKFLVRQLKEEIRWIEETLKQFQVKVEKCDSEEDFVVTGTKEGLARAQKMLEILTSKQFVSSDTLEIEQPGLRKLLLDGRGQKMVRAVEREHECTIEVQHNFISDIEGITADVENFDSDQESDNGIALECSIRTTTSVVPEVTRTGITSFAAAGRKSIGISVKQGDITQEWTDAIVNINSTDMNMNNAGALSKAVAKASGLAVHVECMNKGQQQPGAAVMTSGGNLAVQHIIHSTPGSANKRHLQQCVETCLRLADGAGLRSVSLPAFGTGVYGMSAQCSAELMFQALDNFSPTSQNVREVNIVVFQQQMLQPFTQEQKKRAGVVTTSTRCSPIPFPRSLGSPDSGRVSVRNCAPANTWKNDQVVTFCVLGRDESKTKKAIEALMKELSAANKVQKLEDNAIQLLSPWQIGKLQRRASRLDVELSVKRRMDQITIRGDSNDVLTLEKDVWAMLNVIKDAERAKGQAKLVSKTVQWHYIRSGVQRPFDDESNVELELAYTNDETRATVSVQREMYLINLTNKTGAGQTTGKHITVCREVLGAPAKGIALPTHWAPMTRDPQTGNEETVCLVSLTRGSQEYKTVEQKFRTTQSHVYIKRIQRVQNPHLYQTYMVRKQKMDKDNRGRNNERQLFHGTAAANVAKINAQGFNRSFAGTHGKAYGAGVYFAKDASYSKKYVSTSPGSKKMYLARVLVGLYRQGDPSLRVPPPKNSSRPEITYDSTVDRQHNPSIFVVFTDPQCYPEYLITF